MLGRDTKPNSREYSRVSGLFYCMKAEASHAQFPTHGLQLLQHCACDALSSEIGMYTEANCPDGRISHVPTERRIHFGADSGDNTRERARKDLFSCGLQAKSFLSSRGTGQINKTHRAESYFLDIPLQSTHDSSVDCRNKPVKREGGIRLLAEARPVWVVAGQR